MSDDWKIVLLWGAAYAIALVGSGFVVRWLLRVAGKGTPGGGAIPPDEVNPGRVIGKLEDVLIVSLVAAEAFTALAVIFAAKGIARVEGRPENASYYVLGTLANFTWALAVALVARLLENRLVS